MGPAHFEDLLKAAIGLSAASIGSSVIARAVQERMAVCRIDDPLAYLSRARASATELQELIEAVVVPETWFFRDRESFAALARFGHQRSAENRAGVLSLLSLPCSTGEEPYSMTMALLDAGVAADRFRVDAVDISARALEAAGRAVYGKNSFRDADLTFRVRYFDMTTGGYRPNEQVRRQVRFQQGNLLAPDFLPGIATYDVIFCRNVLIYLDRPAQDRAIAVLDRLLRADGALFVAPAETTLATSHGFVSTREPRAFAFRKAAAGARPLKQKAARSTTPVALLPRSRPLALAGAPRTPIDAPAPARIVPRALPKRPAQALPSIDDAVRLADQGSFVEAATCCEDYLRRCGPSAPALYLMGLVRDATGNPSEAVDYYRKALYLDPNHGNAQIHLALLMEQQGDAAAAQVLRNRARRLRQQAKAIDD